MKQTKKPQVQLSTLKELVEDANTFLTGYYGLPERRKSPDYAVDQTKTGRAAFHQGHTTCLLLHETDRNDPSIIGEEVGHWIHWHENLELYEKSRHFYDLVTTPRAANNADEWLSNLQQWLACEQLIEFIGSLSRLAFGEHRSGSVALLRITLLRNQYRIVQNGKNIAERFHNDSISPEQFQNFFLDHMRYFSGSSLAALAYGKVTNYQSLTPALCHQCLKAPTLDDVRALLKKPETTTSATATSQETLPQPSNPTE